MRSDTTLARSGNGLCVLKTDHRSHAPTVLPIRVAVSAGPSQRGHFARPKCINSRTVRAATGTGPVRPSPAYPARSNQAVTARSRADGRPAASGPQAECEQDQTKQGKRQVDCPARRGSGRLDWLEEPDRQADTALLGEEQVANRVKRPVTNRGDQVDQPDDQLLSVPR